MRALPVLLLVLSLPACDFFAKAEDGDPADAGCTETATVISADDASALGFSGADLLALASGAHDETFVWARDQHTEAMTLTVGADPTEVRYIASVPAAPSDSGMSDLMYEICSPRIEVDAPVSFATETGAFDESWSSTLSATAADLVSLHQDIDPTALTGTYDVTTDVTSTDYDSLSTWLDASFSADGSSGAVSGQASGSEDCDPGDTCAEWAEMVNVGAWGAPSDTAM